MKINHTGAGNIVAIYIPPERKYIPNTISRCIIQQNYAKLKKDWIFFDQFINFLRNNTSFKELLIHKKINLEPIFYKILLKLTKRLNFYIIEYRKAEKIVKKIKPTSIIFQSTAPHVYSDNIFFIGKFYFIQISNSTV